MPKTFRPMKPADASKYDLNTLKFPLGIQPKYDGIRFVILPNDEGLPTFHSYSLKPIRNQLLQSQIQREECKDLMGLDGELMLTAVSEWLPFNEISSFFMSSSKGTEYLRDKRAIICIVLFDSFKEPESAYHERFEHVLACSELLKDRITSPLVGHSVSDVTLVKDTAELTLTHQTHVEMGYEGSVIRDTNCPYKFGRSTWKEQALIKIKDFEDSEATLVGMVPLYENQNTATINKHGLKERGHSQQGKVAKNELGAMILDSPEFGKFEVGTGFTSEMRKQYWKDRELLEGLLVKFKHFGYGAKDKPRMPVFLGFRDRDDI